MVISTDKDKLKRPLNFLLKKATSPSVERKAALDAGKRSNDATSVVVAGDADGSVDPAVPAGGERGTWNSQFDFAMSCIAYAVGLGNVWRFPYLCFKNGGGAFLIPYFIAMITCGIPLFLLEVAVGQYLGVGGMSVVGQLCPILKGVGYSALMMVFLENVYYIIIVAWTLFYILNTVYNLGSGLPWSDCEKGAGTWANGSCWKSGGNTTFHESEAFLKYNLTEIDTQTPVEAYWNNEVLGISSGIDDVGSLRWELLGYLFLAWLGAYLVVWKGLHNSSKIIWFSAITPYVILTVLAVKALSLDGALDGVKFLFTPDWDRLAYAECWIDGGTQIFYSYGVGIGALLALGSYNKFNHNCYRDTFVVCSINTFTSFYAATVIFSILGFMAQAKGVDIKDVVKSGPGLAFLVYPEAVLQLWPSSFWSILFFLMLLALGFDSQFCILESLIVGLVDNWPTYLRPRRLMFSAVMCLFMLILGLPMITQGGVYVFQLMDFYAASGMSLLWAVFFQTFAISYCFGAKKVYACIEEMVGFKISKIWYWCWMVISPSFMAFLFIFYFVKYEPIKYAKTYHYPVWGEVLGFCISGSSMIWVPGYAIYYLCTTKGTLRQRLNQGITPMITMRPDAILRVPEIEKDEIKVAEAKEVEMSLVNHKDISNNV
jgi:solute carrier family 6 GABA transporter-like protein 1